MMALLATLIVGGAPSRMPGGFVTSEPSLVITASSHRPASPRRQDRAVLGWCPSISAKRGVGRSEPVTPRQITDDDTRREVPGQEPSADNVAGCASVGWPRHTISSGET